MARISAFPQFSPKEQNLSRFVKGLKVTVDSMIQEINRIDGLAGSTANILAELNAIEARITTLASQITADIVIVTALVAEAKVLAMDTAQLRTDLDALILRVTTAEAIILTHTDQIAVNTTAASNADTKATTALSTANIAKSTADTAKETADGNVISITARKVTDASIVDSVLTIFKTDGNITANILTDTEKEVIERFPTSVPPNGNVMIGDGSGNLIYRNLDAATIPIQSFHYVELDDATGELVERYAEDTETITIDPLLEYQPGFIQNEFQLSDDGVLSYIG